jgi:hypothetical protein
MLTIGSCLSLLRMRTLPLLANLLVLFCEEDRQQASHASHLVSITLEQGFLDNLPDHFIKGNAPRQADMRREGVLKTIQKLA